MSSTLTFSREDKGWTSFYSYYPEMMVGMKKKFYSFKNGNLYAHDAENAINTFYGVQTDSHIKTVFNQNVTENKLFKTVSLEGSDSWKAELETDIESTGYIEKDWFEKKEQAYYGYVRNSGETPATLDEYALRRMSGIGLSNDITVLATTTIIEFPNSVVISDNLSIGDYIYFSMSTDSPSYGEPKFGGVVTDVVREVRSNNNYIIIDTTNAEVIAMTDDISFIMYLKNAVAETYGILGHYCYLTLTNDSSEHVELFTASSEVMKSNP